MDPEGHPIPQDITGFQFRLIGDMTVKQFAYLAGGAVVAWLFFSSPLPVIIKIPLAGGCALFGVMLAFMPIHGRPADLMLILFFKALFKANQFTFKKSGDGTNPPSQKATDGQGEPEEPKGTNAQPQNSDSPAKPETGLQDSIQSTISNINPAPTAVGPSFSTPVSKPVSPTLPQPTSTSPSPTPIPVSNPTSTLVQQPAAIPPSPPAAQLQPQPNLLPKEEDKVVSSKLPALPSDAINLIAGVVEDPRGNVLQNILVEVTDTAGSPVRAFKTNQMGQFVAATPLENGTYTITLEDPDKRHQFPTLNITAKGEPLQPLEVKSMDQREQLRQSLFNPTEVPPIQQPG